MRTLSIIILAIFTSCSSKKDNAKIEILDLMEKQQIAWNTGSLEDFMVPYWKNDSLAFIGKSGINFGWQTTLDNYKKSYPNKDKMGTLEFNNKTFKDLGVYFHINGQWTLYRTADTLSGHYSLLWKKIEGKWKIINDHSS